MHQQPSLIKPKAEISRGERIEGLGETQALNLKPACVAGPDIQAQRWPGEEPKFAVVGEDPGCTEGLLIGVMLTLGKVHHHAS